MSDNPLHRLASFNRVSIRAVMVRDGEDPGPALAKAGIVDPIALRVVLGDDPHLAGGLLGDGITPNLTAVLETEHQQDDDFGALPANPPKKAGSQPDVVKRGGPAITPTTPPSAFGMQSLSPIRRLSATEQRSDAGTGRFGYRA